MGRLLRAIEEQNKALRKAVEGQSKWARPMFNRRFYRPGTVPSQMPGVDAFGSRPGASKYPRSGRCG